MDQVIEAVMMRAGQPGELLCCLRPGPGGLSAVTVCCLCIVACVQGAGGCEELAELGKGGWFLIHGYKALTWKSRTCDSLTGSLHH